MVEERKPENYKIRKSEKQQTWINRFGVVGGAIVVGIVIYYFEKVDSKFEEMDDTIAISAVNADKIKERVGQDAGRNKTLHNRIEKNEDCLVEILRLLSAVNERSERNERAIEIWEIKN